jgi:acyl-CoA reductase-like NAD-dependent aldehyde dehydrogenase
MNAQINWRERAAQVTFRTECFIGGRHLPFKSAEATFDTVNPATGVALAHFPAGSAADIDDAVVAARKAFRGHWGASAPEYRKQCLLRFAAHVEARAQDFALMDSLEMGKPVKMALGEVAIAVRFLRFYAEAADKAYGEVAPTDPARGLTLTLREPYGVVGAIVPWNFPMMIACMAIGPALAAGNTVVIKPSEISPSSALLLAQAAVEAGVPDGVLNVVPGLGTTVGAALALHMDVDKLHFTGSTRVGRKMLEYAGQSNGKSVMLEVGGKSPQLVFADALDIPGLADSLAASVFFNTGQVCVARSRLLVEESIAEEVLRRVGAASAAFIGADPLDERSICGPVASKAQLERVSRYVEGAAAQGAELVFGKSSTRSPGYFFDPVMLSRVSSQMPVVREEIFGPVLAVSTFSDDEAAVILANGTEFGLAASAWTRDFGRALKLARRIDAGRIEIRSAAAPRSSIEQYSAEPFRGSGHGVIGGMRGLDAYVRHKAVELIHG